MSSSLCLLVILLVVGASATDFGRCSVSVGLNSPECLDCITEYLNIDTIVILSCTSTFHYAYFQPLWPRLLLLKTQYDQLLDPFISHDRFISNLLTLLETPSPQLKRDLSSLFKNSTVMHLVHRLHMCLLPEPIIIKVMLLLIRECGITDLVEFGFGIMVTYFGGSHGYPELSNMDPNDLPYVNGDVLFPKHQKDVTASLPDPILHIIQDHATAEAPGLRILLPEPFCTLLPEKFATRSAIVHQHHHLIRGNPRLLADLLRGGIQLLTSHLDWDSITHEDWRRMSAFMRFDLTLHDLNVLLSKKRFDLISEFLSNISTADRCQQMLMGQAQYAGRFGSSELFRYWVEYRHPTDSSTLLHYAVRHQLTDLARVLMLVPEMDLQVRDISGKTAADYTQEDTELRNLLSTPRSNAFCGQYGH